jgi:hypothetical protein
MPAAFLIHILNERLEAIHQSLTREEWLAFRKKLKELQPLVDDRQETAAFYAFFQECLNSERLGPLLYRDSTQLAGPAEPRPADQPTEGLKRVPREQRVADIIKRTDQLEASGQPSGKPRPPEKRP